MGIEFRCFRMNHSVFDRMIHTVFDIYIYILKRSTDAILIYSAQITTIVFYYCEYESRMKNLYFNHFGIDIA